MKYNLNKIHTILFQKLKRTTIVFFLKAFLCENGFLNGRIIAFLKKEKYMNILKLLVEKLG
jgi:hypothetical protein